MTKYYRYSAVSLSGVAALALVMRTAFAGPVPVADLRCEISPESRARRIGVVSRNIVVMDRALQEAEKGLKQAKSDLRWMNGAYIASKISAGIAIAAGTIAGVGAVYSVFFSGTAAAGELSIFGITSMPVIKGVTISGTALRAVTLPAGIAFMFHGTTVEASSAEAVQGQQISELSRQPLIAEGAMTFLSSASCPRGGCYLEQPQIAQAWGALNRWQEEETRKRDLTGLWSYLSEWYSHAYGKYLAEVQVPYFRNAIDVIKMQRAYYDTLRKILVQDGEACRQSWIR